MELKEKILSIVTPTRGNFSDYWLEQLLAVKGNVEFILVYPPNEIVKPFYDPRLKVIHSSFKGETIQRMTGILNTSGKYILALDDDDFVHPDVLKFTSEYFQKNPHSWVLRLNKKNISYLDEETIKSDWGKLPEISEMEIVKGRNKSDREQTLREIPIAPLENKFKISAFWPYTKRTDHKGPHIENFNNKVWRTEMVKKSLFELSNTMKLADPITWLPFWSLDRLLGLFLQAQYYQKDICVGHWLPEPEQIRYISKPYSLKETRVIFPADALLVRKFPQYGYFWNLFFNELYNGLKTTIKKKLSYIKHEKM
ncbi:glycosyltransferase family 2 protein [Okeania sp.]|uniref:glycosyltransferase family 2 protein n=1 Tax=Okeania sp. TaxID=3100323 RepID=UPI002B4B681A|nr:glycosyltransferase family 2 protein [Okeania sp.]MEB3341228.1 glycosyltransferase family 2 protein [Okeania sp.]